MDGAVNHRRHPLKVETKFTNVNLIWTENIFSNSRYYLDKHFDINLIAVAGIGACGGLASASLGRGCVGGRGSKWLLMARENEW